MKSKSSLTLETPPIGEIHWSQRWSTDAQTWGDSERRQNALAEAWCKMMNLPPPKQSYSDSGLTGKDGRNRKDGSALAELLKIVKPNDLILVEDCDRWSREDPITSLYEMRNVLKQKTISIRFLNEQITVNQKNFMQDAIILPLFFKSWLGNRENTKKGERVHEVYENGKEEFLKSGKVFGSRPPFWLKWNDTTKQYHFKDEEMPRLILRAYKMCDGGFGCRAIAKTFNTEKIPVVTKYTYKNGKFPERRWSSTIIQRILTNRAVLGYNPNFDSEKKMYPPIPGMTDNFSARYS